MKENDSGLIFAKPLTEYQILLVEFRDILQKSAREQDILDGGIGEEIYTFTIKDVDDYVSNDESVANEKQIRHLFNK